MARPTPSPVDVHVAPVRRRLTLEVLLRALVWCWTGGLVLTAVWFAAQPWLLRETATDPRWFVAAGALLLATVAALLLTYRRAPSRLTAALALDERFQLKERTTTLLGLSAAQQSSPAGQALREDVDQRVRGLDIASRFKVRLPWRLVLPPVAACVLVVLALLYAPTPPPLGATDPRTTPPTTSKPELIQEGKDELKLALKTEKNKEQPRSEKLQEIIRDIDEIANNDFDPKNKDEVLEQAKALDAQEKKIEEVLQNLEKKEEQEQQLKKELENLFGKDEEGKPREPQQGPGQKAEDALGKGDLNKAADELNRLGENLKNDKLNDEERKQLQDQLEAMRDRIDKANEEQKKQKQELEEAKKQADKEEEQAKKQEEKDAAKAKQQELQKKEQELSEKEKVQQDLNKLSQKMEKCEKCLKEGDGKEAGKQLGDAAQELKELGGAEQEKKDLENLKNQLENARQKMIAGLDDGMGGGGDAGGRRPFAKDAVTQSKDAKQKALVDDKGLMQKVGLGQGGNNQSKFTARELQGRFEEARQQASETIERQGSTRETIDIERQYFENLATRNKKK